MFVINISKCRSRDLQHYTLVAGKTLTPSIAFTSIAVFDELRFALANLPETFIQALQGDLTS
jgi:hypothetical protein